MWDLYIYKQFAKLACHPAAQFVVAKAAERCSAEQLESALKELKGNFRRLIGEFSAIGSALRSLWGYQRCRTSTCFAPWSRGLRHCVLAKRRVSRCVPPIAAWWHRLMLHPGIYEGFAILESEEDRTMLVPCLLMLETPQVSFFAGITGMTGP